MKRIVLLSFVLFALGCNTKTTPVTTSKSNANLTKTESSTNPSALKALIIDGENNHGVWPKTTIMIKDYLQETGLFSVDIKRTAFTWQGPHHDEVVGISDIKELIDKYPIPNGSKTISVEEPKQDPNFNPDFSKYDLVVSNMGWKASPWSDSVKSNFENFMKNGGGLVIIHAANNSWGDWDEFNKMIGVGGWGGRDVKTGPYVYYDDEDKLHIDKSDGQCGSHGPQSEFVVTTRAPNHPIMKGLPLEWLHTKDELYDRMRGPAENMTVLATAYSDKVKNAPPWDKKVTGSARHEPMLSAIEYGKGRTFHTCMGHMDYSFECVGFITTLQRGSEWAATGNVTQSIPSDFPSKDSSKARKWNK